MHSKLVIFDIDGTLTRTNAADESCFASAVAEYFGIDGVVTDWGSYTHSTDSGIIDELVHRNRGQRPTDKELTEFRQTFVRHLDSFGQKSKNAFEPVAGALDLFKFLSATTHLAIATGGWKLSAEFKLSRAGINIKDLPAAFADDHFSRDDIIKTAVERAKKFHNRENFEAITYVGDGTWDFLSATRIGINFVGIHDYRDPAKLKNAGAKTIVKDYSNREELLEALKLQSK